MAHVQKYTADVLAEMRRRSDASYAWFHMNVLGRKLPTLFHVKLCNQLQGTDPELGAWRRLGVCWTRGAGLKTTIGLGYLLWRGLTEPTLHGRDFSSLLVERKVDHAKDHLDEKISSFFRDRHFARPMMEAIYPERIPPGEFWTREVFCLVQDNPDTPATIHCKGLDSSQEGKHVRFIMCEDLEGADTAQSDAPNEAAQQFIMEKAEPLLIEPAKDQICVVGTPHGRNPTMYFLRDLEGGDGPDKGTLDNSRRKTWKMSWQGVLDSDGNPFWPERTPQEWLDEQWALAERSPRTKSMLLTQYYLERPGLGMSDFDPEIIDACNYTAIGSNVLHYPAFDYRLSEATGKVEVKEVRKVVPLRNCRFYIHGDPKHRQETKGNRRSEWAWIVVAVSPDMHYFVLDAWMEECSTEAAAEQFFKLYRRYCPWRWTFDSTAGQIFFLTVIRLLERGKYHDTLSTGTPWSPAKMRLPAPSRRCIETPELSNKEGRIYDRLSWLFEYRYLHLSAQHAKQVILKTQILRVGTDSSEPIDGADALAQGAGTDDRGRQIWQAPPGPEAIKAARLQEALHRMIKTGSLPRGVLLGAEASGQVASGVM